MADAALPLSFTGYPPAIDKSTPANPQVFTLQLFLANTSRPTSANPGETVTVQEALLLVPVSVPGATNLAASAAMTPSVADTAHWILTPVNQPDPAFKGYAQFELMPKTGGAVPPGGSVAFNLSGIQVATISGAASVHLLVTTSGRSHPWEAEVGVDLTEPSQTPTFRQPWGVAPTDPLQGQSVVISWTSTGAAFVTIQDDLGNTLINPQNPQSPTHWPTSGRCADTPKPPAESQIKFNPQGGRFYQRTYRLTAHSSGVDHPTQIDVVADVWLPTVFSFTASPSPLAPGQPTNLAWSLGNTDPSRGKIALTIAPGDGTPAQTIAIPTSALKWQGNVQPASPVPTTYGLALDNGYATTTSAQQSVGSPIPAGWSEQKGLETLPPSPPFLVTLAGKLACAGPAASALYWTQDGSSWSTPTAAPPYPGGVIAADLGAGEMLWAFGIQMHGGSLVPAAACSHDGITWETIPQPPWPARLTANYATVGKQLVVMGDTKQQLTDVWSSCDGCKWTKIGDGFPNGIFANGTASLGGLLLTVPLGSSPAVAYTSTDSGATWSPQPIPIARTSPFGAVQQVGNEIWLLGANGPDEFDLGAAIAAFDGRSWRVLDTQLPLPPSQLESQLIRAATLGSCLWLGVYSDEGPPRFFRLNRTPPGTTFTLAPAPGKQANKEGYS